METEDRRIIRTKKLIQRTFTDLVEEKGLDHVTIKELTKRANINRGTFYLHYFDKYDLLSQMETEILEEITHIAKELNNVDINGWNEQQGIPPAAGKYFRYLKAHAAFLKAIMGPEGDPRFQIKMKSIIAKHIEVKLTKLKSKTLPLPAEYLVAYIASAHLGVVHHWIEQGVKETPEEMAHIIASMNFFGPLAAGGLKNK